MPNKATAKPISGGCHFCTRWLQRAHAAVQWHSQEIQEQAAAMRHHHAYDHTGPVTHHHPVGWGAAQHMLPGAITPSGCIPPQGLCGWLHPPADDASVPRSCGELRLIGVPAAVTHQGRVVLQGGHLQAGIGGANNSRREEAVAATGLRSLDQTEGGRWSRMLAGDHVMHGCVWMHANWMTQR